MKLGFFTAFRLAASTILGLATCIGIAAAGAVLGDPGGSDREPHDSGTVLLPLGREAISYSRRRTTWCIEETRMWRGAVRDAAADPLCIPWGGWGGQIEARRVPALPPGLHPPEELAGMTTEFHLGWPCRCLWTALNSEGDGCVIMQHAPLHLARIWPIAEPGISGLQEAITPFTNYQGRRCRFVPTGVLTQGMAINTATFALAWSLLLLVPARVRRSLRLRRIHCPHCNYDLRATPADALCPECGRLSGHKLPT